MSILKYKFLHAYNYIHYHKKDNEKAKNKHNPLWPSAKKFPMTKEISVHYKESFYTVYRGGEEGGGGDR